MAIRFNRFDKDEPLSRILFYSVIAHYVIFYFLFGNPFLILLNRGGGEGGAEQNLDVELLSPNQINIGADGNLIDPKRDFPAFPPEEGTEEEAEPPALEKADPTPLSEEGMKTVETIAPLPSPPPKKVARKMPRNMTGPEDCMLKVVAMVCPEGDSQCITEYREFCANLPE